MHISTFPSFSFMFLLLHLLCILLKSPWIPNTQRFFSGCFCYFILGPQRTAYFKDCQSTSNRWTFLYNKNKEWSRCIPWWQTDLFSGNKKTNLKISIRKTAVLILIIYVLITQTFANSREKEKYFKVILSFLSGYLLSPPLKLQPTAWSNYTLFCL